MGAGAIAYSASGLWLFFPDSQTSVAVHPLDAIGLVGTDKGFAWSPDASQIAFLYVTTDPQPCIRTFLMLADLPSGEVRTLNATAAPYGRPAWSPDGKWLAITDETGVLRIARVSDERFFTLSQIALNRVTPAWLDSEHVVYARQSEPQRPADLVSQRIDGSPPVPLLQNMDKVSEFAFSPDRIQLAYYRGSLGLIDFRSATDEPLGQEPSERLQWSPDSSYLLGRGGLAGVFLVHPVSPASVEQLQVLGLPAPSQGWAPDSRHFALLVDLEGGQSMLGVYDIGSRRLQHLNVQIGPPYDFAWSPR